MDATTLLKKDHKTVKELFQAFEQLGGRAAQKRQALFTQIHQELSGHAQVEEELFYPALKAVRSEEVKDLVREAAEEHKVAKALLAEIAQLQPDDEQYNAKVTVLREYVMHHVKEEEKEMFAQAKQHLSQKRLDELGTEMATRKEALKAPESQATR
jgi:hemerythrin superfamily protein